MRTSYLIPICTLIFLMVLLPSSKKSDNEKNEKIKCMIQMKNYSGEGAYIIISLVGKNNNYLETLYVHGDDPEWYHEITSWWKFYGKKRNNIDAITGGTLSGGERTVNIISIDKSKFTKDCKLRFETAVEDNNYYEKDLEIDLEELNTQTNFKGSGFIRYVRFINN